MSTSADSYQPFLPALPGSVPPSVTECPHASPARHRTVTALEGFQDWGKGADFRDFQRQRAESVTTVTAFSRNSHWAEGLDKLHGVSKPTFLTSERWEEILFDAVRFVRDWGEKAVHLGWTELELFGCNPNPRMRRLDNDGLIVLLRGRQVNSIDTISAAIDAGKGDHHHFKKGKLLASAVPLWIAFGRESGP